MPFAGAPLQAPQEVLRPCLLADSIYFPEAMVTDRLEDRAICVGFILLTQKPELFRL